jgi:hypothetical protein
MHAGGTRPAGNPRRADTIIDLEDVEDLIEDLASALARL